MGVKTGFLEEETRGCWPDNRAREGGRERFKICERKEGPGEELGTTSSSSEPRGRVVQAALWTEESGGVSGGWWSWG